MPGSWTHPCSWMQPIGCFNLAELQHPQSWLAPAPPVILAQHPPRVGWDTAARPSLEVPLSTQGRVCPGRASACSRKPSAHSATAQAMKSLSLEEVGQGGACTGTALMVPSCFSSSWLEGKVDFGIWIPIFNSRLQFTPALPLRLHWSRGEPCSPTSSPRTFSGQLAVQHPETCIFAPTP